MSATFTGGATRAPNSGRIMFEIRGGAGKKAVVANPSEWEYTLMPGKNFRVLAVNDNPPQTSIYTIDQWVVVEFED